MFKIQAISENPDKYEKINKLPSKINTIHNKRFGEF